MGGMFPKPWPPTLRTVACAIALSQLTLVITGVLMLQDVQLSVMRVFVNPFIGNTWGRCLAAHVLVGVFNKGLLKALGTTPTKVFQSLCVEHYKNNI